LCGNEKIDIIHHVTIDENELFKYDPESDYYNDLCYAYTSADNTDIILNDRREEFLKNNLTLCENNCQLNGYNS
jgi:urate oxidase